MVGYKLKRLYVFQTFEYQLFLCLTFINTEEAPEIFAPPPNAVLNGAAVLNETGVSGGFLAPVAESTRVAQNITQSGMYIGYPCIYDT